MSTCPPGWTTAALSDIAIIIQGQSPPSVTCNEDGVGLPFYQGKAEFGALNPAPVQWCPQPKKLADVGDILLSVRAPVGPTNVANERCGIGRGLAAIRATDVTVPAYLLQYLRFTADDLDRCATGTTFKAITGSQLRAHRVPIAPRHEQERLLVALESLLSRLDDAVAGLERVQRNLTRYRASVLKAAVEGRLVPTEAELARVEGRSYEPASVLLDRILAERRRRWEDGELARLTAAGKPPKNDAWKSKYLEPERPPRELPKLPDGWCWTYAEALWRDADYGISQRCESTAVGPPVLRIPNVQDERLDFSDLKYATAPAELSMAGALEPGDFVYIRSNGSRRLIGRGALTIAPFNAPHYFASYLVRLRLVGDDPLPRWFAATWSSEVVRGQLLQAASSSAGQNNFSLSKAARILLPIPPLAEQSRILGKLDEARSKTDAGAVGVETGLRRIARLRQSILKWAFEGELVDQDPNDEPAAVLLDRIRAERVASGEARPRRSGARQQARDVPDPS